MGKRSTHARRIAFGAAIALATTTILLVAADALARPGGGDSWSGGGGGGGGGYSGGGGGGDSGDGAAMFQLIFLLLQLCFEYPIIGIPLTIVVIGFFVYSKSQSPSDTEWDSAPAAPVQKVVTLDAMRRVDPDFSQVVFEDFAFRLYAQAMMARRAHDAMLALSPYLRPDVQQGLVSRNAGGYVPVTNVIVGALRVVSAKVPSGQSDDARITLELETNYSIGPEGRQQTMYAIEQWTFSRSAAARTKPPKSANRFPCPNCGAPFETSDGTRCNYCGEVVNNGRFDWVVTSAMLMHERAQPPVLTTEVPERGTNLPTVYQPNVGTAWTTLLRDDQALSEPAFFERARLVHKELSAAWTQNDLRGARPYVSDGLFDYLRYWVETYQRAGLRNVLEQVSIAHAELAKVTRDRYYDAVTLRVFGTGLDYVVDAGGRVVKGSKRKMRPYSEYWTLIRGSQARGQPRTDPNCPSCGAPLKISMAGSCEYCQAHVTAGEFDWVLSKIEQDDTYRG